MMKTNFPLSSEQLELLILFEQHTGLNDLAKAMGRDPSVISRQLQKLASEYPVISKEQGKWILTSVGRTVNEITNRVREEYERALAIPNKNESSIERTALILINAQRGLNQSKFDRSNPAAEKNMKALLDFWRSKKGLVIHVLHISDDSTSVFFKNTETSKVIEELTPFDGEIIIEKSKSSAFTGTDLLKVLESRNLNKLALVGFTANECIEATAKDAYEMGLESIVVGDATAMFDFLGHDRKIYKASKIHELVLANIGSLYSVIEKTENIIRK